MHNTVCSKQGLFFCRTYGPSTIDLLLNGYTSCYLAEERINLEIMDFYFLSVYMYLVPGTSSLVTSVAQCEKKKFTPIPGRSFTKTPVQDSEIFSPHNE